MCTTVEKFGSDPATLKWQIIRGDSSLIRIDFLQNDETTHYDTTGWTYLASAYDPKTDIIDPLTVVSGSGYVQVKVDPSLSAYWGSTYRSSVAELMFDLEVTIDDTVWTPVIGTITVLGDVSGTL